MNDDDLTNKAKSALDDSVDNLDENTNQQLFAARQKALNELEQSAWWQTPMLKPLGAVAAGLMVFMVVSPVYKIADNNEGLTQPTDIELVATVDNLEMVEELEMIQWLLESEDYAG